MTYDETPPRLFTVVTSAKVNYNMDTVEYLINQEHERRAAAGQSRLNTQEINEFRRQLIVKLIIQNDAEAAINLRPSTTRSTLFG